MNNSVELVRLVLDRLHLLPVKDKKFFVKNISWIDYVTQLPDSVHGCAVVVLSKGRLSKRFVYLGEGIYKKALGFRIRV